MARTAATPRPRDAAEAPGPQETRAFWRGEFRRVRAETEARAARLSAEDQIVQSMADASPTKWHRAHVTWFFEQFLLKPHDPGYADFDERFAFLFNSYYVAAGPRHARPQRGLITRPNGEDVAAYRAHVDAAVERLIENVPAADAARVFAILEIGLHHEQQHQELLITDILHAFAQNPTDPVYDPELAAAQAGRGAARLCRCAGRHPEGRPRRRGLLLRQRDTAARRADSAGAHRAPSGHQRRVARVHGGRRLHDTLALAVGRLGRGAGGRLAGARLLAPAGRRLAFADARRIKAGRSAGRGHACQLFRGRGLRALCRQASAERARMGSGRSRRLDRRRLRHRLAMDAQRLSAVSGLPRGRRRARRIQRQVHGRPDGAARLVARDPGKVTRARATAISFIRRRAGSSAGFVWPSSI